MSSRALKYGPAVVHQSVVRHVLTGMAIAAAGFGFVGLRPDLMVIEHVEFAGLERSGQFDLRHLSELRNGTTVWSVDTEQVARAVERHPWVKHAEVALRWPGTLYIDVQEYEPIALVNYDGLYYVDATGSVIVKATSEDLNYPVLTGMGPGLEGAHPDLPQVVLRDATWLLRRLMENEEFYGDSISEIHFSRERGFTVHAKQAQLVFGAEGLERRVQRLGLLLEHGLKLGQPVVVDLVSDSVAIVRPRDIVSKNG